MLSERPPALGTARCRDIKVGLHRVNEATPVPMDGYLLLADISGYSKFLTGTELEHSHAIVTELTRLIRSRLVPPMRFVNLEGGHCPGDSPFTTDTTGRSNRAGRTIEADGMQPQGDHRQINPTRADWITPASGCHRPTSRLDQMVWI